MTNCTVVVRHQQQGLVGCLRYDDAFDHPQCDTLLMLSIRLNPACNNSTVRLSVTTEPSDGRTTLHVGKNTLASQLVDAPSCYRHHY